MVKLALRVTRKLSRKRGRNRKVRPKSFRTKELAEAWAKAKGNTSVRVEARGRKYIVKDQPAKAPAAKIVEKPVAKPVEKAPATKVEEKVAAPASEPTEDTSA